MATASTIHSPELLTHFSDSTCWRFQHPQEPAPCPPSHSPWDTPQLYMTSKPSSAAPQAASPMCARLSNLTGQEAP